MPKKLYVNTATKEDLEKGLDLQPEVADRVIRMRVGKPFENADELSEVDGIGPNTVKKIKDMDHVVFSASEGADAEGKDKEDGSNESVIPEDTITGTGTMNEKGEFEGGFKVDIGKLLNALSKSSKERDWKRISKALRKWAKFTVAVVEALIKRLPEGREKERIRRKARELKEKLDDLEDAINRGDEDAAEDAADDVEDLLDDLEDLLEDAGIELPDVD